MKIGKLAIKALEVQGFILVREFDRKRLNDTQDQIAESIIDAIAADMGVTDLIDALFRLEVSVTEFCNLNGISGDLSARLSDARAVLNKVREE